MCILYSSCIILYLSLPIIVSVHYCISTLHQSRLTVPRYRPSRSAVHKTKNASMSRTVPYPSTTAWLEYNSIWCDIIQRNAARHLIYCMTAVYAIQQMPCRSAAGVSSSGSIFFGGIFSLQRDERCRESVELHWTHRQEVSTGAIQNITMQYNAMRYNASADNTQTQ